MCLCLQMSSNYRKLAVSRVLMQTIWKQIAIVLLLLFVWYFEGWRKLKSPPDVWWWVKPEKEGEIMFSSHTAARWFSNRNRLMHNYAEPICRGDFITDAPCKHSLQSQACILMPIRERSWHMCALFYFEFWVRYFFSYKVYGLSLVYLPPEEKWKLYFWSSVYIGTYWIVLVLMPDALGSTDTLKYHDHLLFLIKWA